MGARVQVRKLIGQRRASAFTSRYLAGFCLAGLCVTAIFGCAETSPAQPPDVVPSEPDALLSAILDTCHGRRQGQFDRCVFELRVPGDPLSSTTCILGLPTSLRLSSVEDAQRLIVGDRAWAWRGGVTAYAIEGAALQELRQIREALGMLFLRPLYDVAEASALRTSPTSVEWLDSRGTRWRLDHAADRLLPTALARVDEPESRVEFLTHFDSGVTRIPSDVRLPVLGVRNVFLSDVGTVVEASAFVPPQPGQASAAPAEFRPQPTAVVGPDGVAHLTRSTSAPSEVSLAKRNAVKWLAIPDGATWTERHDRTAACGSRLGAANKSSGGNPALFTDEHGEWLGIPFRDGADSKPLELHDGERIVTTAYGEFATLSAPPGLDFDSRVQAATGAIDGFLAAEQRVAAGPIFVEVNYSMKRNDKRPERLQKSTLKVFRAVAPR